MHACLLNIAENGYSLYRLITSGDGSTQTEKFERWISEESVASGAGIEVRLRYENNGGYQLPGSQPFLLILVLQFSTSVLLIE